MQRLIIICCFAFGLVGNVRAADLASYRATYEIVPWWINKNVTAEPLAGTIDYEMRGSNCAGYSTEAKFRNQFAEGESGTKTVEVSVKSYEGPVSKSMTTDLTQRVDGRDVDLSAITLHRDDINAPAKVRQTGSKNDEFEIAPKLLFPTAHQQKLLDAAIKGKIHDVSVVYDGTEGSKVYEIISFISKKNNVELAPTHPAYDKLKGLKSWQFQLGYYAQANNADDLADYQSTFQMYENGVATEMLFNYGNYIMKAKLLTFEPFTTEACNGAKPK